MSKSSKSQPTLAQTLSQKLGLNAAAHVLFAKLQHILDWEKVSLLFTQWRTVSVLVRLMQLAKGLVQSNANGICLFSSCIASVRSLFRHGAEDVAFVDWTPEDRRSYV